MAIEISWQEQGASATGSDGQRRILDGNGPFHLGRSSSNTLVLEHPQVSRAHAEVTVDGRTVRISDRGSQNGTFVGGQRISGPTVWPPDTQVGIGPFLLSLRFVEAAAPRPIPIAAATRDDRAPVAGPPIVRPAAAPARSAFPGRLFDQRIVPMADLRATGRIAGEYNYVAVGGGCGSFCWVDHLRIFGVPASDIRVIGVADDKRPYAKWGRLCRNSQIPDHERIRSNSISVPDNIWGFPGYASREMVRDLLQGRLVGFKHVIQVFGEPALTESYTPRIGDVYRSFDVEAERIGWNDMFLHGQVVGLRKTDDERFVVAYRVPSSQAPDQSSDQRERFIVARYIQLATGYPASNFLPDLQDFRHAHPDSNAVVNAYEPHDEVYRALEQKGGTVLIRGRGIVASRVIQRIWEAREKNKDIRLLHLVRSPVKKGQKYDLARRDARNDVEQQPFNWPKSAWGGTLRVRLERASPEERARLLANWGGTTTADREDWNQIIEQGTREGWYKIFYGNVAAMTEKAGKIVTRLESTAEYQENVDLVADYIVDCTGLIAKIDETPLLADLIKTYDLARNRAAGQGAELRLSGIAVNTAFEIPGLQNGRGHVWAAGVVTANGPYAAVDSFLGLQYAALRSVDHLGALRAPSVSRFGPLKSAREWVKWCLGRAP